MTAHMDSVPMLVVTGQQVTGMLGKDAFQEADIFGITMPIVKHSYLVKETDSIPRIVREAYHIATTGRPRAGTDRRAQGREPGADGQRLVSRRWTYPAITSPRRATAA